jgi:hypothetical protein
VIAAREIGPDKTKLIKVDESRFKRWLHDVFGSDEAPPPPPPVAPKRP